MKRTNSGSGGSPAAPPRAADAAPAFADQLLTDIRALRSSGRLLEATRLARAYVAGHPQDEAGHAELGLLYLQADHPAEALASLLQAVRLAPEVGEYREAAGMALETLGRDGEAMAAYRTAIARNASLPTAFERLGTLLRIYTYPAEAAACFRSAAAFGEPSRRANNLAMALRVEQRTDEAEAMLTQAVTGNGDSPSNRLLLGAILRERGRFEEAVVHLEAATGGSPAEAATAYFDITHSKRVAEADRPTLTRIAALLADPRLPEPAQHIARFALGKGYDDLGDHAAAMRHYEAANRLVARRRPFDRAQFGASVNRIIASSGKDLFASRGSGGSASELPVLIVGMPRSGTTLVEQIVSSHPAVAAGDELPFWFRAAEAFGKLAGTAAIRDWLGRTGADYLAELSRHGADAARVTDKMPGNFLWLGLYHLVLPRARIVHCRRNPVDTCLSNYFMLFTAPIPQAYDKGDLAFYYRAYRRLMAHWREVLPAGVLFEIDYEELVADPEPATRRLLAFLGLDWDPACLHPEANRRAVRTASQWQVRQKIHRGSVERWRRYAPWLGELASLLDESDGDGPVHPQSGNAALPRARELRAAGRADEAIAAVQAALRADPRDAVLFSELGTLFLSAGRGAEAAECFWHALGLNPNFAVAHCNLGAALAQQGQLQHAIASLRRAIASDPALGLAYRRLGELLQLQGAQTEALESFRRAGELESIHNDPLDHVAHGDVAGQAQPVDPRPVGAPEALVATTVRTRLIRPIATTSEAWLSRHRDTHVPHPEFGTHRHPYLHDLIRSMAEALTGTEKPTLLDYGCGKGSFAQELERTGWFRFVRGYDPAVEAFKAKPAQPYDIVLCLDVLDQLEDAFVASVIEDVAQLTRRVALFDVITLQTPALAHLTPRSAAAWQQLIGERMRLQRTIIRPATAEELRHGACPERTLLFAGI